MAQFTPPHWLQERQTGWVYCHVSDEVPPVGYAVAVNLSGQERTMIAPENTVRVKAVPGDGTVRITIVAELSEHDPFGDGLLAELPAVPQEGSQRVKVRKNDLTSV